jgi:hypothetical protein
VKRIGINAVRTQGMFPCEEEIARRLSQHPGDWARMAPILEREGLPRIDPLMGGRCWDAVQVFFLKRYGLGSIEIPSLDGEEDLNALR